MFANHPAARLMKDLGAFEAPTPLLDSAALNLKKQSILDAAGAAELADIRGQAVATLQQWATTPESDLDEGETLADRLLSMFIGLADQNMDGDVTEDEADLIQIAMDAGYDYLLGKGVTDADASALLNDGDSGAAERIADLLTGEVATDDEAADDIDSFAFDEDSQASLLDSAVFDAVYKRKMVVRGGRKVRVNKRVSGTVRLTAAQKVAIRKAGMKAHSAAARMRRLKSVNLRAKFGLK